MKRTLRRIRRNHIFALLDVVKFALILVLLLMFIEFNATAVRQSEDTKKIAESTNSIVKSQGDILAAIKQVTEDTRITAQQQTSIIICMLQVPIEARTVQLQQICRDAVKTTDVDGGSNTQKDDMNSGTSSTKPTPNETQPQSFNSQNIQGTQ